MMCPGIHHILSTPRQYNSWHSRSTQLDRVRAGPRRRKWSYIMYSILILYHRIRKTENYECHPYYEYENNPIKKLYSTTYILHVVVSILQSFRTLLELEEVLSQHQSRDCFFVITDTGTTALVFSLIAA